MSASQARQVTAKKDAVWSLLNEARSMIPTLRAREQEAEERRSVHPETIAQMRKNDLFKVLQPVRYGGLGGDLVDFVELAIELGRGSGSAAWIHGNVCLHSWIIGMFPAAAQDEIWKDPNTIVSSCLRPAGIAERVNGGFKIKGRWPYVSGCDHTDWTILGAMIPKEDGTKEPAYLLVPKSDYQIIDEWFVTGLAATGSKDLVIEDGFVPEHRIMTAATANSCSSPGVGIHKHPIYSVPLFSSFSFFIAAPIVGMAVGAIEQYTDYVKSRATAGGATGGGEIMATLPTIQLRVGEAQMRADAAAAVLLRAAALTMEGAGEITVDRRIANRRAHSMSTQLAVEAIDQLNEATGASGILTADPTQRAWRNIHAGAKHFSLNWDAIRTMCGQYSLGIDPKLRMF